MKIIKHLALKIRISLFILLVGYFNAAATQSPIVINTKIPFEKQGYKVPAHTDIELIFNIKNIGQAKSVFIDLGDEQLVKLYEENNGKTTLIGQTGARVPIHKRSIITDGRFIEVKILEKSNKKYLLHCINVFPEARIVKPVYLEATEYYQKIYVKSNSFYNKYWTPIYFGLLVLVLLLTVFQYFVLPERVLIFYFFYLFFTFIRSTAYNEFIVLENLIPFLRDLNYSSLHSQVFTYLSFIFYVYFLREFTGFPAKKPGLDNFYKIQIGYLVLFVIFDLIFSTEKYTVPKINNIFRALEFFGMVIGGINLLLLFKVYDSFNKYILVGALSLFLIAIFGQEIYKRVISDRSNYDAYRQGLSIIWSIGYAVEIFFFTWALINRQRLLLQAISYEKEKNVNLLQQIESKNKSQIGEDIKDYESFTLATNRGVLVFQQSEIVRLEASGNYTIFSINNSNPTLGSYTLADFEQKLNPSKFLRVHKSHVVNLQYVVKYKKGDGGWLTLEDGSEIPVSRSRKDELLKRLQS